MARVFAALLRELGLMVGGDLRRLVGIALIVSAIGVAAWIGFANFRPSEQSPNAATDEQVATNNEMPVSNEVAASEEVELTEPVAVQAEEKAAVPTGVSMKAEDIVEARRAAFYLSAMAMSRINAGVKLEDDIDYLQWPAAFLSQWADALPLMFPEGSLTKDSKALKTVWTDRAGFEKHAADFARVTAELSEIARTGNDKEAFKAKREQVIDACDACHDRYHVPD